MGKFSDFLALSPNISKTVADTAKSHMGFPLTPRSMTLDDLELLWGQMFLVFRDISRVSEALTSSRGWTTAIRHSPAFHHISRHGCSQWWTPPLGSSFSSSRFQHITPLLRQLHWLKAPERIAFKQSVLVYKCLHAVHGAASVYLTDELCEGARCRGSSSTPFQFIFIIDCQPHPTPYCQWPSFSCRRCTCLEQSAWSCHFRTFCSSLPVPV